MQPWWWRSVAACASVLVLAGLVAVVAGAVEADRATAALRPAAAMSETAPAGEPVPREQAPAPTEVRVPDAVSATSLALLPGWRTVPAQDVVEVPPGRFVDGTILQRGPGTVVLVGLADPARVTPRPGSTVPDPAQAEAPDAALDAALTAEAQRLADAYADLLAPGADTADLTDNAEPVADLPTRTSVRRVEGGELDGALVRVSTLAAPGRTVTVLAVARPAPDMDAEGDAADAVVRSLRLELSP